MNKKALAPIRFYFAQSVFTHVVQQAAANRKEKTAKGYKLVHVVLVFLVLVALGLQAVNLDTPIFSFAGIGLTIAEIAFLIIQRTFDNESQVVSHSTFAAKYRELRDEYMLLISDIMNETIAEDQALLQRDILLQKYQLIGELAPRTTSKDYTSAQKSLNKRGKVGGEEFTWSDEEIDHFLPPALRF